MRSIRSFFLCALFPFALAACTAAIPPGAAPRSAFLAESGTPVLPPAGIINFCIAHADECASAPHAAGAMELTAARMTELETVQEEVNVDVAPRLSPQHVWDYPVDGEGNCNNYALEKRRELEVMGWPREDLLLAVVMTETNEGHLVLVVRTSEGDLVLDNREGKVTAWNRLPYRWLGVQSVTDLTQWHRVQG